jgi:protein-S-isoprenylcysteine O-methyltransferase Ste14
MPTHLKAGFLASAVLFLGLAVLGWGGVAGFFADPARTAAAVVTALLAIAALFTEGNMSAGLREARDRWVLASFFAIAALAAYVPAYCDRHGIWTFDGDVVRWLGVALYAVGGVVRLKPVFVLGHRFSALVAIQPGHKLVTDGIYGVVRHPSYLGMLINLLGWVLVFRSAIGIVLWLLIFPPLLARIRVEEALLAQQFGAAYEAYRANTARLLPGIY